ncbi:hypothetical protein [uncultured Paludibaculum sp.]|uniref:hypothetical protein n=1 Tax=uncultured Paludibaculum sp. TaxID=1765020 RepID=UPI002AAB21B3|nr:hypothetical protein [uncultured Paludibaculum sp.]
MRDRLTYFGGGAMMLGLLCVVGARIWPEVGWVITVAEILIAVGVLLLLARLWKHGLN